MAIAFPVDALALISVASPPAAPDAETVPVSYTHLTLPTKA